MHVQLSPAIIIMTLIAAGFAWPIGINAINIHKGPRDNPDDFGDEPDQEV